MNKTQIEELKNRILSGGNITEEEAKELSLTSDKEALYSAANDIREALVGEHFDMCSITNAKSGKCSEDCKWCSQSAHHSTDVEEYDIIDKNFAVNQAIINAGKGVNRYSLVTSGRAISNAKLDELCLMYEEIDKKADIHMCASMGLLKKDQLAKLKATGVKHYHCNLETAPSFFNNLCSTHTAEEKMQTIKWAQEVGLEVCSGGIIGMGETMEHRIEMAFALRELKVDSIPINILNPIEGTPMEGTERLSDEEILATFAMFRFINPKAQIRFAGGRDQIKHIEEKALKSGVSAALVGDLLTTLGSNIEQDRETFTKAGFKLK